MLDRPTSTSSPAAPATEGPLRCLVAATAIIPTLIFALAAFLSYQHHFSEARFRLDRSIDVVYEHAAKVFETLDLVAAQVDQMIAGLSDQDILNREAEFKSRTEALAAQLEQVQFVLVIDGSGRALVFSAMYPTSHEVDYSGRDYFQALRSDISPADRTAISAVLRGRVRGDNTTFLIARRRGTAPTALRGGGFQAASFRGIIAVSTKPSYFTDYYRRIARDGVDTVTLLRTDGALLARYPEIVNADTPPLPATSTFMTTIAQAPERGSYETVSAVDQARRLYAYRRLPKHPIYVTAGIDHARVLADWRSTLASQLVFGLPATVGLVLLALTALKRTSRESAAMAELAERKALLRDAQDFARLALSAVGGVGVWTYEVASDLFFYDAAIAELYALDPARGLGGLPRVDFLANVHPDDRAALKVTMSGGLVRSGDLELEYRICHPDGSVRWMLSRGHTYHDGEGRPLRRTGVGVDVTNQRQTEEALRQAQKMEAVGQLTGGLAHDFNNLLAGISGSLELMKIRMGQGRLGDLDRYMTVAQGAAKRAAALTHRLLAFSRRQTLAPKATNVNRLINGMEDLIRRTIGPEIALEMVGASGLWPALVDPGQLENALLNLCINARDAMPAGGRITIETANTWLDRPTAMKHDIPEGQYLSLCVSDTGTGMPPEVVARVFEPFFTTKPIGQGTGLGLSMIHGFAQQSGGQVRIYSEVGEGTTVCLYLPRHYGDVDADDVALTLKQVARAEQGETVLIVDDEPSVRMLVTEVLEDLGYTAIEAADSLAGLKVLQSDARIDLLITDVGLPGGMNGRQMADAARVRRHDLKVLFVTGYAENAVLGHGHLEPGMEVLTKPFAMEALASRIKGLITAP